MPNLRRKGRTMRIATILATILAILLSLIDLLIDTAG